jgi:hypothetical protein
MLIVFKSRASGDVIMFEKNGKEMLSVLGKNPNDSKGIITVEQLPDAMSAVKAAIEADKAMRRKPDDSEEEAGGDAIRLFQRALPFLELLERSLRAQEPVTWGV